MRLYIVLSREREGERERELTKALVFECLKAPRKWWKS
jgi:hypothetical protein